VSDNENTDLEREDSSWGHLADEEKVVEEDIDFCLEVLPLNYITSLCL
jgi:hypothetical protein